MNIPAYPNHLRPCTSLNQAVNILSEKRIALKDKAVAHYVRSSQYGYGNYNREIFSYNFFSPEGRNVGTFIPSVNSFQFQSGSDGKGRVWGIESPDLVEVSIYIPTPV